MSRGRTRLGRLGAVAPVLLAAALGGCQVDRDAEVLGKGQFWPAYREAARQFSETRDVIARQRALQVVGRICDGKEPPGDRTAGAGADEEAVHEAVARLCGPSVGADAAVRGSVGNAYKRWLEDRVRELPDPADTATSAAGDS